ncbi:LacI family DNA-binding transcriptional regulator [Kineococcus sp. TBRC 1896]|uniref:LacI family DNA-binding transcriptional regulator n=1 Tax=Kineococcus mangrovi TaxID=1660183 RepID=A0ABV4I931_9ACTN
MARRAGVSPAVVSYVVNGGPRSVSATTRSRVEEAIATLDYRPNAVASALRGGTTKSVGLLLPGLVNPYFTELAHEVERELFVRGNTLSIGMTDDDPVRERAYIRSFVSRRFDGLLVVSPRGVGAVTESQLGSTPVVLLDPSAEQPGCSSVHVNHTEGTARATEHLQGHGHTSIGVVAGPPATQVTDQRIAGWRRQQQSAGLEHGFDLLAHADFSSWGGLTAARNLLGHHGRRDSRDRRPPTALVVSSDVQAMGVLEACRTLGLAVPGDVALVSFDGTDAGRYAQPSLTSLRQPIRDIASTAVTHLLQRVASADTPVRHTTLTGHLRIGGSCGCAPGPG